MNGIVWKLLSFWKVFRCFFLIFLDPFRILKGPRNSGTIGEATPNSWGQGSYFEVDPSFIKVPFASWLTVEDNIEALRITSEDHFGANSGRSMVWHNQTKADQITKRFSQCLWRDALCLGGWEEAERQHHTLTIWGYLGIISRVLPQDSKDGNLVSLRACTPPGNAKIASMPPAKLLHW